MKYFKIKYHITKFKFSEPYLAIILASSEEEAKIKLIQCINDDKSFICIDFIRQLSDKNGIIYNSSFNNIKY